jgi:hypothetical protein
MKNPSIQDNPFLPLTIRRAVFHPPLLVDPDTTIATRSHLHQNDNANHQAMHRPISQILYK